MHLDFAKCSWTLLFLKWTLLEVIWTLQNAVGPCFFGNGPCKILLDLASREMNHVSRQMDYVYTKQVLESRTLGDSNTYLDFINTFLDDFSRGKDVFYS